MELKHLILLSMLVGAALGQGLNCTYTNIVIDGTTHYGCYLTVNNPDGRDNFTTIEGVHLEGRTDADVTAVLRNLFTSRTTNFPQIICSQFANLESVDFSWMDVEELTENTLAGCTNLRWLRFWLNEIHTIHERAFANNRFLRYLDLDTNRFESLSENVFDGLDLWGLELSGNAITIPNNLFSNLNNLTLLFLMDMGLTEINSQWLANLQNLETLSFFHNQLMAIDNTTFANLRNLKALEISRNPFESISSGAFSQLTNLIELFMAGVGIDEINSDWFSTLTNLEYLFLYNNRFRNIQEGAFDRLTSLLALDISGCRLPDYAIPGNLFNSLSNMYWLDLSSNLILNLNPDWFRNSSELAVVNLNFNQILALPNGVFSDIRQLMEINLWGNQLKTVNRNSFGAVNNLMYADFDDNSINAIDELFLQDAGPLFALYLWGNLCTGERFYNFADNRAVFLQRLLLCTRNHRFIVETDTQGGADYQFFPAAYPGLQLRVNTTSGVRITLTSFEIAHNPMIEIVLGANNNTVSQIVRNQDQVVVSVPTPNILNRGFPSGFRITWSQHVILVSREDQQFPFMGYSMEDWYSIQFYGLQGEENASWSIQPVQAEISPNVA